MIKKKDYLIRFNGNKVVFLSWREIVQTMDIKGDKLDQIYTYFSLYALHQISQFFSLPICLEKMKVHIKILSFSTYKQHLCC